MVQVYPQWQNYWFPPDTDAFDDDYGSPYMVENDIDAFYNSSTVFNDLIILMRSSSLIKGVLPFRVT